MRKNVVPRFFTLLFLYVAVFAALVIFQFTRGQSFTRKVGDMVVSGRYGDSPGAGSPVSGDSVYPLSGGVRVLFGGMEFSLARDRSAGFALIGLMGQREAETPISMALTESGIRFQFSGGTELGFFTLSSGGSPALRIIADFQGGVSGLELPFKPQKSSGIRDSGNGGFIVMAGDLNYGFDRSTIDSGRRLLILNVSDPVVSYQTIRESREFLPEDFIVPEAGDMALYAEAIGRWRDHCFSLWSGLRPPAFDEEIAVAYAAEAAGRESYRAAITTVSAANFEKTYESAAFTGGLAAAQRSLAAQDRGKSGRLSRLVAEKSPDILRESQAFEYWAIRGQVSLMNNAAEMIRTLDGTSLSLDMAAGLLEGSSAWKRSRPAEENPFDPIMKQTLAVISQALRANPANRQFFAFDNGTADVLYNCRLGTALAEYAQETGLDVWAALGRSLVLSVLSLQDPSGSLPAVLTLSEKEEFVVDSAGERIGAANLYRILRPGDYYPRFVPGEDISTAVASAGNGIWAWTAASSFSVAGNDSTLTISVSFPPGETHYMIIRGINSFSRLQLHNVDYRTDTQFERYDSSGWTYSTAEQTLMIKMRHRSQVEDIRIFFSGPPPSPSSPAALEEAAVP